MGSIAAETRRAVDRRPFLRRALRAGVLNYSAAARELDVSDETDAVASALRRYAEELPPPESHSGSVRVRMERGTDDRVIVAGRTAAFDSPTAIILEGEPRPRLFANALGAVAAADVSGLAAGTVADRGVLLVPRGEGATALRHVEAAVAGAD
ncbi:MAG: hypothetical protein ABEJ60_08430 [Halodesulfurarchaeum sp.]